MKKVFTLFVLLFAYNGYSTEIPPNTCQQQLADASTIALSMDYKTFDQTPGKGLRSFTVNCQYQAFLSIKFYLQNKEGLTQTQVRNLTFQAAQALASSGKEKESLIYFKRAKTEINTTQLLWNEYIDATIAFIEKDIERLKHNRRLIAAQVNYVGNQINLRIVDQFIEKFDQKYSDIK